MPAFLRHVLLPWLVSRALIVGVALAVATGRISPGFSAPGTDLPRHPDGSVAVGDAVVAVLGRWDGLWYRDIAVRGYGFPRHDPQTAWPFFPLLPWAMRLGAWAGWSPMLTGVVMGHLAFLLGLAGLHRLASRNGSAAAAALATWALALFPGSTTFSMVYPSAILLGSSVWSFAALGADRAGWAGGLAAVATLVRPNGLVVAASLAAETRRDGRQVARVLGPSLVALAIWMVVLTVWTGDPWIWVHAKEAWHEVTLPQIVARTAPLPRIDALAAAFGLLLLLAGVRLVPRAWWLFGMLWLVPSLFLGIVGFPRYVATCFPVFVIAGRLLEPLPARIRAGLLGLSALALLHVSMLVLSLRLCP